MRPDRDTTIHISLCVGVFFIALVPRLYWAWAAHPQPFSDMEDYYLCAVNFVRDGLLAQSEERVAYRPPLYPLFLSSCLMVFERPLAGIRMVQAVLGSASVVLIYLLALQIVRVQRWVFSAMPFTLPGLAALSYALFEHTVFFSGILMSETFFIFALLIWLNGLLFTQRNQSKRGIILLSLGLGVLALIRPLALVWLPLVLWLWWRVFPRAGRLRLGWLTLLGWLVPIAPWSLRNMMMLNALVLITTNSGVNFFIGHSPVFGYYEGGLKEPLRQQYAEQFGYSEVGEDRFLFRMGVQSILDNPAAELTRSYYKLYFLYWLEKPPWPWEEYPTLALVDLLYPLIGWSHWFVVLALGGFAVAAFRRLPYGLLLSAIVLYTLAMLIFFARTRFRMPIEPVIMIYAWLGMLSLADWGLSMYRNNRLKTEIVYGETD